MLHEQEDDEDDERLNEPGRNIVNPTPPTGTNSLRGLQYVSVVLCDASCFGLQAGTRGGNTMDMLFMEVGD